VDSIIFHARGLHSGQACSLILERAAGAVRLLGKGGFVGPSELKIARADRGVQVRAPGVGIEIDLIEHLFGALCGLGVRRGVAIRVIGPEVPLLDGGAGDIARALVALGAPRDPPRWRVAQAGDVHVDGARYAFEPGDRVEVEVEVEFEPRLLGVQRARWNGSHEAFIEEIAPARTFGFRSEAAELRARGRAGHVDPQVVLVFEEDGSVAPPARPAGPSELARHKLLDLLGDLYLFGGPLQGRLFARRPGHSKNHRALGQALEHGWIEPLAAERS
jgi:UDP-3-O-[3-hydroxymyristoyl] N-acetylglucosamine deacetylase